MKKSNQNIILPNPQEHHENLNACINCIYENGCVEILPFPLNLSECCENYKKINKTF